MKDIKGPTRTDLSFGYPEDFDPDEMLDASFDIIYDDPIELKVWSSADQARYIKERKWANKQKIIDHDDGPMMTVPSYWK